MKEKATRKVIGRVDLVGFVRQRSHGETGVNTRPIPGLLKRCKELEEEAQDALLVNCKRE